MFGRHFHISYLAVVCCAALILCIGVGCPRTITKGTAKVTTVFTADSGSVKNMLIKALVATKGVVDVNDIESLTVTISGIALVPEDDMEPEDETEGEEETSKALKAHVEILPEPFTVNLLDLTHVSEVLSSAEVPAGTYSQIRLEVSDPILVLKSDTATEITNVKLTANGHLFITQTFELQDGEQSLLLLDFGGVHLALNGNGRYVLTPQLQADLTITSAEVNADGEVTGLDVDEAGTFTLLLADGELNVDYGAAVLETDLDPPPDPLELMDGQSVQVKGLLQVDGSVVADSVRILSAPSP